MFSSAVADLWQRHLGRYPDNLTNSHDHRQMGEGDWIKSSPLLMLFSVLPSGTSRNIRIRRGEFDSILSLVDRLTLISGSCS